MIYKSQQRLSWLEHLPLVFDMILFLGGFIWIQNFPEQWWIDLRQGLRADTLSSKLVLIGLDRRFAERYKYPDYVPMDYVTSIIRELATRRPRTIALDIQLPVVPADTQAYNDLVLAIKALNDSIRIVVPTLLEEWAGRTNVVLEPPEGLSEVYGGYDFLSLERPSELGSPVPYVRSFSPRKPLDASEKCFAVAFPLVAVAAYQGDLRDSPKACGEVTGTWGREKVDSLENTISLPIKDRVRIEFAANPSKLGCRREGCWYYSSEVLLGRVQSWDSVIVRDKLVLVALTYPTRGRLDLASTPFGEFTRGVVNLFAIDTLLNGPVTRYTRIESTFVFTLLIFGLILYTWTGSVLRGTLLSTLILFGYLVTGLALFYTNGVLIPMSWPLQAGLLAAVAGVVFNLIVKAPPAGSKQPIRPLQDSMPGLVESRKKLTAMIAWAVILALLLGARKQRHKSRKW